MTTLPPRKPLRANRLRHFDPERPLTEKQWRFVDEYLLDMNATAAARRAGYGERSAAQNGYGFLQRANVAAAIEARLAARRERMRVTAERVIEELARIAFADVGRIMSWSGEEAITTPSALLSEDDRAAIAEVATVKRSNGDVATRVVLHDKERALEALCRYLGLFRPGALPIAPPKQLSDDLREKLRQRIDKMVADRVEEAREADRRAAPSQDREGNTGGPEG